MKSVHRTKRRMLAGVFVAAAAAMVLPVAASAKPEPAGPTAGVRPARQQRYSKLLECVRLDGVREHQAALQAIADANGGTRADQTQGHLDSVEYVYDTMTAAGWDVEKVPFEYPAAEILVEQVAPTPAAYTANDAIETAEGEVTAGITTVDVNLAPPRDPVTSGCEAADFAGFAGGQHRPPPARYLHVRLKVANAQAAGASAVSSSTRATRPGRTALDFRPTRLPGLTSRWSSVSFPDGAALASATTVRT